MFESLQHGLLRGSNQGGAQRQGQGSRELSKQSSRYDLGTQPFGQYASSRQYQRPYQGSGYYEQRPSYQNGSPRYQSNAYQYNQSSQPRQEWRSNQGYQNNQGGLNQYSNGRALPPPTNRLQITAGPSNDGVSASNQPSRQPFRPLSGNQPRGNGYSPRPLRAYQATVSDELAEASKTDENDLSTYSPRDYYNDAHHGDRYEEDGWEI